MNWNVLLWESPFSSEIDKVIKMKNENKFQKSISIRCDEKMSNMLDELEENMLLNTTSVMRLALASLYKSQIEDNEVL